MLTPGPYNETYFEHAYLARYLGFTLVEGGDLTVRDRVLYLKTLGGLERVDVLLRRVDDVFCDRSRCAATFAAASGTSARGRGRQRRVPTALGSGLVETPALSPSCRPVRELLGEDLALRPSPQGVRTRGRSSRTSRASDESWIKPALPSPSMGRVRRGACRSEREG